MREQLGKEFLTIVRAVEDLRELLESDPFKGFRLARGAKRIVTFGTAFPLASTARTVRRSESPATTSRTAGEMCRRAIPTADSGC